MVIYDLIVPILPALVARAGGHPGQVGLLFAIYGAGFLVTTPLVGLWCDRYSGGLSVSADTPRKKMRNQKIAMIVAQGALALSTILFNAARTFWILVAARLLQGVAAGAIWTLGLALVALSVPSKKLGMAIGLVFGFNNLGFLVGPLLGGILSQVFSLQMPFYVGTGLCIVCLISRLIISPPPIALLPEKGSTPKKEISFLKLLRFPEVLLTCLTVVCGSLAFSGLETMIAEHLEIQFGLDPMRVAFAMMAIIVPCVLSAFVVGRLADRLPRYFMMLVGLIAYAAAGPIVGAAPYLSMYLVAFALFGASNSLLTGPALPELAAIVTRIGAPSFGQVYAISNVFYAVGLMVGPVIASACKSQWNFLVAMCFLSIPSAILIPPFLWLTVCECQGRLSSQRHEKQGLTTTV